MAIYNSSNSIPQPSLGHGCYTPCSPTTAILRLKLESIVEQSPHNIPVIHHIHLIPLYPQIPAIDSALAFSLQSPTALYFFFTSKLQKPHNTYLAGLFWKPRVSQVPIVQTQVQSRGFEMWPLTHPIPIQPVFFLLHVFNP